MSMNIRDLGDYIFFIDGEGIFNHNFQRLPESSFISAIFFPNASASLL